MANKILEYELRLASLKDHKSRWASKKKLMEETLASEKEIAEVLKWIKGDNDPEKSLREIGGIVTSSGRYPNCAQWILRGHELQNWSRRWFPQETQRSSKRMIWVNGPYGTGKTTIMYGTLYHNLTFSDLGTGIASFLSCRVCQRTIYDASRVRLWVTKGNLTDPCE